MEELQSQNEQLRLEVEKLQQKYHDLIFVTYVKSNPITTFDEVKRLVLESLNTESKTQTSFEVPQTSNKEVELYKAHVLKLEEQKSTGNEQLLQEIQILKQKEQDYLEKLRQQDFVLEESAKAIELLRNKQNQPDQSNFYLPPDTQEVEALNKQIEELKLKETTFLEIISSLQQQLEDTKSTNETNDKVKHLVHTNELLQQNITKLEQELSSQKVEEEKTSLLCKELERKLSQVNLVVESLKLKNKEYEDEIASLTFREKAISSESLMKQLSELIEEREKMQFEIMQLKLKLDTTQREFETKETQYNYKIKELEAVNRPLPIQLRKSQDLAASQNPQDLSQFLTTLDSDKSLESRKQNQTIEELKKSSQVAEALASELQEKIKAMDSQEAKLRDKVTELSSELESCKQSCESAISEYKAQFEMLQKINEELSRKCETVEADCKDAKLLASQKDRIFELLQQESKETETRLSQLRQDFDSIAKERDQLRKEKSQLEVILREKEEENAVALKRMHQETETDANYSDASESANARIKELESDLTRVKSDRETTENLAVAQLATIQRLEKELADALETVRSSVSMNKDLKDIEAQLEEKEQTIIELKEKQSEDKNTIEQLTNQMKMKVKVLQKLTEEHEKIKHLNQEYSSNAHDFEEQIANLKREKDEMDATLSQILQEKESLIAENKKVKKEKEELVERYEDTKKTFTSEMQSVLDEKDQLSQEKGNISEKLLEQQKLYKSLQHQFDTAKQSFEKELQALRSEKDSMKAVNKSLLDQLNEINAEKENEKDKENQHEKETEKEKKGKGKQKDKEKGKETIDKVPELKSPTKIPEVIHLDKSPNKLEATSSESKTKEEAPKSPLKSFFAKKAAAPPASPKQDPVPEEEKPTPKRLSLKKPPTSPAPSSSVTISVPPSPIVIDSPTPVKESAKEETLEIPQQDSQGASPIVKKVVVCFSGFKEDDKSEYSSILRSELIDKVVKLGGEVKYDAGFDRSITHVITPPKCRTMKTLAAALTKRWLVSPEWVAESSKAGRFLPEEGFGVKHKRSIFKNVTFFVSEGFKKENEQKSEKLKNFQLLLEQLGGGKIVNEASEAQYALVASRSDDKQKHGSKALTWNEFIEMIPSFEEVEKKVRFEPETEAKQSPSKPVVKRKSTDEKVTEQISKKAKKEPEILGDPPQEKPSSKKKADEPAKAKPEEPDTKKPKEKKAKSTPESSSAPEKKKAKKEVEVEEVEQQEKKAPTKQTVKKRNLSIPKKS